MPMPSRKLKTTLASTQATPPDRLAQALAKHKKTELIASLVGLANVDRRFRRWLEAEFAIATPPQELINGV